MFESCASYLTGYGVFTQCNPVYGFSWGVPVSTWGLGWGHRHVHHGHYGWGR